MTISFIQSSRFLRSFSNLIALFMMVQYKRESFAHFFYVFFLSLFLHLFVMNVCAMWHRSCCISLWMRIMLCQKKKWVPFRKWFKLHVFFFQNNNNDKKKKKLCPAYGLLGVVYFAFNFSFYLHWVRLFLSLFKLAKRIFFLSIYIIECITMYSLCFIQCFRIL